MRFLLAFIICLCVAGSVYADPPKRGGHHDHYDHHQHHGQAHSHYYSPTYYVPGWRYSNYSYYSYRPHQAYCSCRICYQKRLMYQRQLKARSSFFFQFRF